MPSQQNGLPPYLNPGYGLILTSPITLEHLNFLEPNFAVFADTTVSAKIIQ